MTCKDPPMTEVIREEVILALQSFITNYYGLRADPSQQQFERLLYHLQERSGDQIFLLYLLCLFTNGQHSYFSPDFHPKDDESVMQFVEPHSDGSLSPVSLSGSASEEEDVLEFIRIRKQFLKNNSRLDRMQELKQEMQDEVFNGHLPGVLDLKRNP